MKDRVIVIITFIIVFTLSFSCIFYILSSVDVRKTKIARDIVILTKKADSLEMTDKSLISEIDNKKKDIEELNKTVTSIDEKIDEANLYLSRLDTK